MQLLGCKVDLQKACLCEARPSVGTKTANIGFLLRNVSLMRQRKRVSRCRNERRCLDTVDVLHWWSGGYGFDGNLTCDLKWSVYSIWFCAL